MLVEFSVGNFRSFHRPVTLSMQAAKLRAQDTQLDQENVFQADGYSLLRSAAIYGANASGKSNLIRALSFMRDLVLHSSKESQAEEAIAVERFRLNTAARESPAHFQVVFYLDGRRYRYGFEVDERRVHAEWLYHAGQRETRLFVREGNQVDLSSAFREGQGLAERTRDNALFLSVVAQFNGRLATKLLGWFRSGLNIISGLADASYRPFTLRRFEQDEAFRERILSFVREADLAISDINIERRVLGETDMPKDFRDSLMQYFVRALQQMTPIDEGEFRVRRVMTTHRLFDLDHNPAGWEQFDMGDQESEGTKKLFYLSGLLLDTLEQGSVLVIDEMEARLHPSITRAIIGLFNSSRTNPRNAQLIFVTHDTGLLSRQLFRRDQIWFTEKDRYGATDLYSLAELQVRNDASYDKDYVSGKYGAIPFIGGLRALFEEEPDGEKAQAERA